MSTTQEEKSCAVFQHFRFRKVHENKDSTVLFKCTINKRSAYITIDLNYNVIRTSVFIKPYVKIDEETKNVIRGMKRKIEEDPGHSVPQVLLII
ncbi:unnamed protein product [Didymodactylos carnosus]|uniref:Uncharacterized protein n=1 Tax=Didymodactylos carnosus TaxID=1234261 RepID=A0A813Z066_9BILA|nr:unnamed protein product [Didymodactylos carnosus]CAF0891143.1 unnamed protein product [Didymodactylos carnosus]CAF3604002.1 unnamed protein product [Didymodactylos carnosus]CAF3675440.1 unnamed protein product [Didymodactylos carnosus]